MDQSPVFLIAEAGVNHNGDIKLARDMVALAHDAGASAVKFQCFSPADLVVESAGKAKYQQGSSGKTQREMLTNLALSDHEFTELKELCDDTGIEFMSTAFDSASLSLLKKLGVKRLKIPSGELTNYPFLIEHGRCRLPLIVSTGMASLNEISLALSALSWGWNRTDIPSSVEQLRSYSYNSDGDEKPDVTLLHCTSAYPAPTESLNLNALETLQSTYGYPIGYSDHSLGNLASGIAIAKGVVLIEKHFTLDPTMDGPDHSASMAPADFRRWVTYCAQVVSACGSGIKHASAVESDVKAVARKSLVAQSAISKGEVFSSDNLTAKRPGGGRPPEDYFELLGTLADRDYKPDDVID